MPFWTDSKASALLLAGGGSRRMGQAKAMMDRTGQSLMAYLVSQLADCYNRVVIVAHPSLIVQAESLLGQGASEVLKDYPLYAGEGPLAGMYSAMIHDDSTSFAVFAVDLPFLSADFVRSLQGWANARPGYDAWIPMDKQGAQPLCAVYRPLASQLYELLASGRRSLRDLERAIKVDYIPETEWLTWAGGQQAMFNMNTPDDYEQMTRSLNEW